VRWLADAVAAGFPLRRGLALLALSPFRFVAGRALFQLELPMGLRIYAPLGYLPEVVRNALHVFFYRDYEALSLFKPREGWIVADVGAFVGIYAVRAAKLVGSGGRVVAVEPLPEHAELVAMNAAANSLANVKIVKACVSDRWGEAEMLVPPSPINATLKPEYARAMGGARSKRKVWLIPLDALLETVGPLDLVKIDVEGSELDLLRGSVHLNPRYASRLVIEVHTDVVPSSLLARELERRGYTTAVYLPEEAFGQAIVYAYLK